MELPLAVKKLEGFDQEKEFQSEVNIIGGIHRTFLFRLKGFCAEGGHWLLAYEFTPNGSDKWISREIRIMLENVCLDEHFEAKMSDYAKIF
ncbi:G-type lectin S-receptor-like serine/threonine-protein kinase SD2-5, partial [Bienertia sinuspersici]